MRFSSYSELPNQRLRNLVDIYILNEAVQLLQEAAKENLAQDQIASRFSYLVNPAMLNIYRDTIIRQSMMQLIGNREHIIARGVRNRCNPDNPQAALDELGSGIPRSLDPDILAYPTIEQQLAALVIREGLTAAGYSEKRIRSMFEKYPPGETFPPELPSSTGISKKPGGQKRGR